MNFYENIPPASSADECIAIDRVYTLALSEFSPSDWKKLEEIYTSLPGWIGSDEDGCACWHGTAQAPPCLTASVEPSGLHLTGLLHERDWEKWHQAFATAISSLPVFEA